MNDMLTLQKQVAGLSRAVAQANLRADRAEQSLRDVTADRDRWRARAQLLDSQLRSIGEPA